MLLLLYFLSLPSFIPGASGDRLVEACVASVVARKPHTNMQLALANKVRYPKKD